jgi:hypothetical protein
VATEVFSPAYCRHVLQSLATPVDRTLARRADLQPGRSFLKAVSKRGLTDPNYDQVKKSLLSWGVIESKPRR